MCPTRYNNNKYYYYYECCCWRGDVVYIHAGGVVVTLNTRVVRALFGNYVTVYVVGDGRRPVEHLQLTLPSLWRSEGPFELWVVLNVRHRERKLLGGV